MYRPFPYVYLFKMLNNMVHLIGKRCASVQGLNSSLTRFNGVYTLFFKYVSVFLRF